MSYEQARKDIQEHFATNFTALAAARIAWDNVQFSVPTDDQPWVRVSVQNNVSNDVSTGKSRRIRREGIVFIQVFVIENSETLISDQLVDSVVGVFETKLKNGVFFRSPHVSNNIGVSNGWYQVNVSVPYYFDDIKEFN